MEVPGLGPNTDLRATVGADGTAWVWWETSDLVDRIGQDWVQVVVRFDGTAWERFEVPEQVPFQGIIGDGNGEFFEAAPDGAVWFAPWTGDRDLGAIECDGLARFDGTSVTRYLRGQCLYNLDMASDGTVWALAGADYQKVLGLVETHVIPPTT